MKRPTFFQGVLAAAALAFFASVVVAGLTPFVGLGTVIRFTVPATGLAYVLYLLSRASEKTGRVTIIAAWFALAAATWWLSPSLTVYVLAHVAAVWLVRSLYYYTGILPALIDLGLCLFASAAMVWAIGRSGSVFLAVWCFFLVQALFTAIPPAIGRMRRDRVASVSDNAGFESARRQADKALRELFTQ